jgi:hypothetical protein
MELATNAKTVTDQNCNSLSFTSVMGHLTFSKNSVFCLPQNNFTTLSEFLLYTVSFIYFRSMTLTKPNLLPLLENLATPQVAANS